jgi:hypothetical protein
MRRRVGWQTTCLGGLRRGGGNRQISKLPEPATLADGLKMQFRRRSTLNLSKDLSKQVSKVL